MMTGRTSYRTAVLPEALEGRALLSATVVAPIPLPVDISRLSGQQTECTIAINPLNPSQVFAASNETGASLFAGVSADGGARWSGREIATGADGLPRACCDPSAAFDEYGNLFLTYLNAANGHIDLLLSTDAGRNFTLLSELNDEGDQPTVVADSGSVWVTFQADEQGAIAYSARDSGINQIGKFKKHVIVRGLGQNVGDIAIGPAGQVLVAYQQSSPPGSSPEAPENIVTQIDPDGRGPHRFSSPAFVTTTNVGNFDKIRAQVHRTIDAEVGLAYDRSGGPYSGRVYMVYTDEQPDESNDTDILLRYSDNNAQTWSAPVRVNDDATTNSQFFPHLAVDPTTGNVAITWYDARNDVGIPGQGGRDQIANNEVQVYGAVGAPSPDGVSFSPNFQVTSGVSSSTDNSNPNDFGDYTGLAFFGGKIHPAWGDNSNSTGDNPDGVNGPLDMTTATITVSTTPAPVLNGPRASLVAKTTAGKRRYKFSIVYTTDPSAPLNVATLSGNNVQVTGPNGFVSSAQLKKVNHRGVTYSAVYTVTPPSGSRAEGHGVYTIALQSNQVADVNGHFAAGRTLFGTFSA